MKIILYFKNNDLSYHICLVLSFKILKNQRKLNI